MVLYTTRQRGVEMIKIAVISDVHGEERQFKRLAHELEEKQPDLIIDNGDFFYGSPEAFYYEMMKKRPPILDLAKELISVAVPGNHEFTHSYRTFKTAQNDMPYEWICANVSGFIPYVVKHIKGIKLVIIGLTTPLIREWDETSELSHLDIRNPVEALKKWIPSILASESPDLLIVSYHGGFERDPDSDWPFHGAESENEALRIAHAFPEIDLLITGHQHLRMNTEVNGVHIVQPGSHAIGYTEVMIDTETASNQFSSAFRTIENNLNEPTEADEWLDTVIAEWPQDTRFSGMLSSRLHRHRFHDLMHEVFQLATGAQLTVFEMPYLENGGFFGSITRRDVLRHTPHAAPLQIIELTGSQVKTLLEESAAVFTVHPKTGVPCFSSEIRELAPAPYVHDVWGGIDYTVDITRPVSKRITQLQIGGRDVFGDERFEVAISRYRLTGYDFPLYTTAQVVRSTNRTIPEILLDFIAQTTLDTPFGQQAQQPHRSELQGDS